MVSPKTCFHQKKCFHQQKICFTTTHVLNKNTLSPKNMLSQENLFSKKINLPKNMLMQNYPNDQNGPKWSYICPNGHKVSKIVRNGLNRKNCPKSLKMCKIA